MSRFFGGGGDSKNVNAARTGHSHASSGAPLPPASKPSTSSKEQHTSQTGGKEEDFYMTGAAAAPPKMSSSPFPPRSSLKPAIVPSSGPQKMSSSLPSSMLPSSLSHFSPSSSRMRSKQQQQQQQQQRENISFTSNATTISSNSEVSSPSLSSSPQSPRSTFHNTSSDRSGAGLSSEESWSSLGSLIAPSTSLARDITGTSPSPPAGSPQQIHSVSPPLAGQAPQSSMMSIPDSPSLGKRPKGGAGDRLPRLSLAHGLSSSSGTASGASSSTAVKQIHSGSKGSPVPSSPDPAGSSSFARYVQQQPISMHRPSGAGAGADAGAGTAGQLGQRAHANSLASISSFSGVSYSSPAPPGSPSTPSTPSVGVHTVGRSSSSTHAPSSAGYTGTLQHSMQYQQRLASRRYQSVGGGGAAPTSSGGVGSASASAEAQAAQEEVVSITYGMLTGEAGQTMMSDVTATAGVEVGYRASSVPMGKKVREGGTLKNTSTAPATGSSTKYPTSMHTSKGLVLRAVSSAHQAQSQLPSDALAHSSKSKADAQTRSRSRILQTQNAPGYSRGSPSSTSWSFFSRANLHSPRKHPFPPEEVPYVSSYDRETMDYQWIRNQVLKKHAEMLPWSKNEEFEDFQPRRVLDVGCGIAASWIVEAADVWKQAEFVGLDIAPVLLPLPRLPASTAQRIRTVQSNYLDRWPFEDGHFDFVRLAFLGMGVPEQAWEQLFEEATRVLRPGSGWVQCIDVLIPTGARAYALESGAVGKLRSATSSARASIDLAEGLRSPVTPTGQGEQDASDIKRLSSSLSNHSDAVQQTKMSQLARAFRSIEEKLNKHNISAYPTSIFPAAFVLTCSNIVSEGPIKFDGHGKVLRPNERDWSHDDILPAADARILDCVAAEAVKGWPSVYYEGRNGSSDSLGMRDYVEHEKSFDTMAKLVRQKGNVAQLLNDRFGWYCKADEKIETALTLQVAALEEEKRNLKEQSSSEMPDEHRLMETERALRDTRADLDAARQRLGRTPQLGDSSGRDQTNPFEHYSVAFEVVMKAGRKAD